MGCHGVLTGHVPTRQSRLRPTAKESKITEPPQNLNGDPANCKPADTIRAHRRTAGRTLTGGTVPAGRKHRSGLRECLGESAEPNVGGAVGRGADEHAERNRDDGEEYIG